MNIQQIEIGSLAMDLKRASLGSTEVYKTFLNEAIKRKSKITTDNLPTYIQDILISFEKNSDKEDLLMYSTLLQNYCLHYGRKN